MRFRNALTIMAGGFALYAMIVLTAFAQGHGAGWVLIGGWGLLVIAIVWSAASSEGE